MTDVLVVLARAPQPGEGKTRLRRQLGQWRRTEVDRLVGALTRDTLAWACRSPEVVVAGRGDAQELRRIAPLAHHVTQAGGEFGSRIDGAVDAGFAASGRHRDARVVQIGTDSPTVPHALLDAAFACLRHGDDAALVPALDGGWIAVGVSRPLHGALGAASVRWSTEHAAADTVAALRAAHRRVTVLPPWYDVDDVDGLPRLQRDPAAAERAPRTLAAAMALRPAPPATG